MRVKRPESARSQIHPVFDVGVLKLYHPRTWGEPAATDVPPEHEVDAIVNFKAGTSGWADRYRVSFKGYSSFFNLWLPISQLTDCDALIASFWERRQGKIGHRAVSQKRCAAVLNGCHLLLACM